MRVNYLIMLISPRPRRYRVIEGTLKGRQTVATLFWAQQYQLQGWFGYRRQLQRAAFDQQLAKWAAAGVVVLDKRQQTVRLTDSGAQLQRAYAQGHYLPQCGHLSWLVNTKRLSQRMLLGIQTVSELAHHQGRYAPLGVAPTEMAAVKSWFYHHRPALVTAVPAECQQLCHDLAGADPRWPNLWAYSLVGFQTSGLYTNQFERLLHLPAESIALMDHDVWLTVAQQLRAHRDWLLAELAMPLIRQSPLSSSAQQTLSMYQVGSPLTAIARRRHLKVTTVREHLLAAAILLPGSVDARSLIGRQRWAAFRRTYQGPVENWQWDQTAGADPAEAFFAFRLYQIVRSQNDE